MNRLAPMLCVVFLLLYLSAGCVPYVHREIPLRPIAAPPASPVELVLLDTDGLACHDCAAWKAKAVGVIRQTFRKQLGVSVIRSPERECAGAPCIKASKETICLHRSLLPQLRDDRTYLAVKLIDLDGGSVSSLGELLVNPPATRAIVRMILFDKKGKRLDQTISVLQDNDKDQDDSESLTVVGSPGFPGFAHAREEAGGDMVDSRRTDGAIFIHALQKATSIFVWPLKKSRFKNSVVFPDKSPIGKKGFELVKAGKYREAISTWQTEKTETPESYFNIAMAHILLAEEELAVAALQRAVDLDDKWLYRQHLKRYKERVMFRARPKAALCLF